MSDGKPQKALRATEQPKWRTNPSSASDKRRLADYANHLEGVVLGQQAQLSDVFDFFKRMRQYFKETDQPKAIESLDRFIGRCDLPTKRHAA